MSRFSCLDETLGFSSVIATTNSPLFLHGCRVTSDSLADSDFWFSATAPVRDSDEFHRLRTALGDVTQRLLGELEDSTPILVEFARDEAVLAWPSEKQASFANSLINRFLRAYEHTYFDLLVPRHRLDGRPIVLVAPEGVTRITYAPVVLDLFDVLDHYLPGHMDIEQTHLGLLMGMPEAITPSWRILRLAQLADDLFRCVSLPRHFRVSLALPGRLRLS